MTYFAQVCQCRSSFRSVALLGYNVAARNHPLTFQKAKRWYSLCRALRVEDGFKEGSWRPVSSESHSSHPVERLASTAGLRRSRTLRELLVNGMAAIEDEKLDLSTLILIAKEKENLFTASWRSVLGMQEIPLASMPLPLVKVFLNFLLECEFSGKSKWCRISVHDQLYILRATCKRDDFQKIAKHKLIPILIFNGVEHLNSHGFPESLGDQCFETYTMFLKFLACVHGKAVRRRRAVGTVFEFAAPFAVESPECLLQLLQSFSELHAHVLDDVGSHLLASSLSHLQRSLPLELEVEIRDMLSHLLSVSGSFAEAAVENLSDEVANALPLKSRIILLVVTQHFSPSGPVLWSSVRGDAELLSIEDCMRLLSSQLSFFQSGGLEKEAFQERASVLLDCISRHCQPLPPQLAVEDLLPHCFLLSSFRGHAAIQSLGQAMIELYEKGPQEASPTALARLAYVLSLLEIDLPLSLFPEDSTIDVPSNLVSLPDDSQSEPDSPERKLDPFAWVSV